MKTLLLIGIGSFIGGLSRYFLSIFIQTKSSITFPYGTLLVNLIGCFLIGIVYGLAEKGNISQEMRLLLATGLLGGFTTFSAFSNDTVVLLNNGHYGSAFTYVFASVVIGLVLTFLGILITRIL